MRLNADFSRRVVIRPRDYEWVDSPMPGVERMMLDRIGDEVARATSLVRYAPGSTFSRHVHTGGEEFLVLEGEFGDEHNTYPRGTYVRNPIGTSHTPRVADSGCTIFVKLQQFDEKDDRQFSLDTTAAEFVSGQAPGIEYLPLHNFESELVKLIRLAPDTPFDRQERYGGEEMFVLDGAFHDEFGDYPAGTWLRSPAGSKRPARAGDEGALLYVKTGHLPV
jgi:anti-sigma factor ChrR (cupin superfamily)